jgi:Na+/H+-translocating membrane pyrophosphatase
VVEVRRQFHEHLGHIMDYTEKPERGPVVDICIRDGDASWSEGLYEGVLAACFTLRDGIGRGAWARLRSLVQKV